VLDAVRADNWLHAHGDLRARQARDNQGADPHRLLPGGRRLEGMVFERSVTVLRRPSASHAV